MFLIVLNKGTMRGVPWTIDTIGIIRMSPRSKNTLGYESHEKAVCIYPEGERMPPKRLYL